MDDVAVSSSSGSCYSSSLSCLEHKSGQIGNIQWNDTAELILSFHDVHIYPKLQIHKTDTWHTRKNSPVAKFWCFVCCTADQSFTLINKNTNLDNTANFFPSFARMWFYCKLQQKCIYDLKLLKQAHHYRIRLRIVLLLSMDRWIIIWTAIWKRLKLNGNIKFLPAWFF